ncbi:MAG: glycogen synthase GlgA [Candidatus Sumerlaeia bacterium]
MRILFLSAEVSPFAKTGGLADVLQALPQALHARGHDVRIAMPLYSCIDREKYQLRLCLPEISVHFPGRLMLGRVYEGRLPQSPVPVYFIENPALYDRPQLYGEDGLDYPDNAMRFGFYQLACLWMLKGIDWSPEIYHCNDWQSGLVPLFLRRHHVFGSDPFFAGSRSLYTIHNLGYLGVFHPTVIQLLGLPADIAHAECMEFFGGISFMKGGIYYADRISTVSEQYAREILTPEFGCGLEGYMQFLDRLPVGILNGVDYSIWNPETDPALFKNYDIKSLEQKEACKADLLNSLGWPVHLSTPLVGMISRLDAQKGLDLIEKALPKLIKTGAKFVFLGSGDPAYQEMLLAAQTKYPDQVHAHIGFNAELAHRIEAGVDAFLMPSRYEPCGLNQMFSLKYGTIPIVRHTGGLADTVQDMSAHAIAEGHANGFVFEEYSVQALVDTVKRALEYYRNDKKSWRVLQINGMRRNFSWDRSAELYEKLYHEMHMNPRRAI